MLCEKCGRDGSTWDIGAIGHTVFEKCTCGHKREIRKQTAYTTSETDEYSYPSERILKNHGWLKTCKFRTNPTYKASEGTDTAVSGSFERRQVLALLMFEAIFSKKKGATVQLHDGTTVSVRRRFKNDLRSIETENYMFVEQNPWMKGSKWAKLAQEGQKIMWVINKKTNTKIAYVDEKGVHKTTEFRG